MNGWRILALAYWALAVAAAASDKPIGLLVAAIIIGYICAVLGWAVREGDG